MMKTSPDFTMRGSIALWLCDLILYVMYNEAHSFPWQINANFVDHRGIDNECNESNKNNKPLRHVIFSVIFEL